ncbi:MAG: acetolactate synthase small subunit [Tumebacillaceae bacterium]
MSITLDVTLQPHPAALARVTDVMSRCVRTIDSFTLQADQQQGMSHVTVTVTDIETKLEEMLAQLHSLQDVVSVHNHEEERISNFIASQITEAYM